MKIKILYLYYDLMNLYGESGNVRVLERHLKDQGLDVIVECKSLEDTIDFLQYDFIYCGSGTESKQKIALSHMNKYKEQFVKAVDEGKVVLFTGTAFEMLGKSIISGAGNKYEGIGIFNFISKQSSFKRTTGDVIASFNEIKSPIVGFINKCSEISDVKDPLFSLKLGVGNDNKSNKEGSRYKNLFATYITGPILVKNPDFLEYLICLICEKINGFKYKKLNYDYEAKAYQLTLSELNARIKS